MADPDNYKSDNYKTYVRESHTAERSSGNLALIVGGLVVAVGFVLWFLFGAFVPGDGRPVSDDDTTVTIEPAAPAADTTEPVVPDVEPVEPAPVEPDPVAPAEPAPADE